MPSIYEYEVELKLTNKNTKAVSLKTTRQHAYSVQDALYQAMYMVAAESSSSDVALVRIGPPAEAISRAADRLNEEIAAELAKHMGHGVLGG